MKKIYIITIVALFIGEIAHAQRMSGGIGFYVVLCNDSTLNAWGDNSDGQLGDSAFTGLQSLMAIKVKGIERVIAVSAGATHVLALRDDSTVWAWGENIGGVLGVGSANSIERTPMQVIGLTSIIAISAGQGNSMALKSDGTVWTWGSNYDGQLGNSTLINTSLPAQVLGLSGITAISAGVNLAALTNAGTVYTWGDNQIGQLGIGFLSFNACQCVSTPTLVGSLSNIAAIFAKGNNTVFIKNDSTVWTCGRNSYGELGIGSAIANSPVPVQVPGLTGVKTISQGNSSQIFALKYDGTLYGWGHNDVGAICCALGGFINSPALIALSNVDEIVSVYGSYAIKNDGRMYRWGGAANTYTPTQWSCLCGPVGSVWPGDTNNDSLANNFDLLPLGLYYGQTGIARAITGNFWQPDSASNWGITQTNGNDLKYVDCNGDASLNANDTLAINQNFSSIHFINTNNNNISRLTAPDIYFVTSSNTYNPGDVVDIEVWVGNSTTQVTNLYGLAFNINYTASLVQPGTESLTYPVSWLGTPGADAITIAKVDVLATTAYGAETRTNHTNASGYGKIADFTFQTKTTISTNSVLYLSVSNYMANDSAGVPFVFNTINDSITIHVSSVGVSEGNNNSKITISPNPFTSQTTITFNDASACSATHIIKIMDVAGREMQNAELRMQNGRSVTIDMSGYAKGIYFVRIVSTGSTTGVVNRKIVLQ